MADVPEYYFGGAGPIAGALNQRWWLEDDPAQHLIAVAKQIETDQSSRRNLDLVHARLYENQDLDSLYSTGMARGLLDAVSIKLGSRVTFNVIQSCIDTAQAKIAKNKPRVVFLTTDGDWAIQRRAKKLTQYADGLFYASKIYEQAKRVFTDAGVFGTGVCKIYVDGSAVKAERVLPGEIFADDTESVYATPRSIYQRKFVYRDVLLEKFGGKNEERRTKIMQALGAAPTLNDRRQSEMVAVYEAWHLPSGKKSGDGRHVIAIDGCLLFDEEWKKDYFPFIFFRWTERLIGLWGRGICEQLHGIQSEINYLLKRIKDAQHLCSVPRVLVEKGSKIEKAKITNEVGAFIEYTGAKPDFWVQNSVPAELYQHLERLYQKAFEVTGISMLSATSRKPEGLDAGVALREYHDIESERFVVIGQRYEELFIDAARIMIDLSRDLYERNEGLRVLAPGTKVIEQIPWKEVDLDEDQYVMRAFPTSILPSTPAGRLQKVQELYQAGLFGDDEREAKAIARSLLDFPDIESAMSLQNAAIDDIKRIIENITDKGKYETPEPYMNLPLAIRLAQSAYLKGRSDGLPEKRLAFLRQLIDECQYLIKPPAEEKPEVVAAQLAQPAGAVDPAAAGLPPDAAAPPPDVAAAVAGAGAPLPAPVAMAPAQPLPIEAGLPALPSNLPALPPPPVAG